MVSVPEVFADAAKMAAAGDRIYDERWRRQYEPTRNGEFVAIGITTGEAFLGKAAVEALEHARAANHDSFFHLIRVGSDSAYRGGFLLSECLERGVS
jgi:hypothetical protein